MRIASRTLVAVLLAGCGAQKGSDVVTQKQGDSEAYCETWSSPGNPAHGLPDGNYCGGVLQGGDPGALYQCQDGLATVLTACAYGCGPSGEGNAYCAPKPGCSEGDQCPQPTSPGMVATCIDEACGFGCESGLEMVGGSCVAPTNEVDAGSSQESDAAAVTTTSDAGVSFTEFEIPTPHSSPFGITSGPDGNIWFIESAANKIGKLTPTGTLTEFPIPTSNANAMGITAGPDGNLWFTENTANQIGRVTPGGVITEFSSPIADPTGGTYPEVGITTGPDGNIWYTVSTDANVGYIGQTTRKGSGEGLFPTPTVGSYPSGITSGPDGNVWFTEIFGNRIGRLTPQTLGSPTMVEFLVPSTCQPSSITSGPDGNLWFAESANKIGKITPAGAITEYPTPNSNPTAITAGPDGNLWFLDSANVGRITTSGVVSVFPIPTADPIAMYITSGPDGALWFTEGLANKIGRVQP